MKKLERKAEQVWRTTKIHRQLYVKAKFQTTRCIREAKQTYILNKLQDASTNPKQIYQIINSLTKPKSSNILPDTNNPKVLADNFSEFFQNKVEKIMQNFDSNNTTDLTPFAGKPLNQFSTVITEQIAKLISSSAPKSCSLDPIPTNITKSCISELAPVITDIVNSCIEMGIVPDQMKLALVNPLLKKPSLDPDELKNYRSVSNLSFISKIMEKVVAEQMICHLRCNNLIEPYQSAYKSKHSTETALMRVQNDILKEMDANKTVFLVLLDLSAAFDTLEHQSVLRRLSAEFGITETALSWFTSYLCGRFQTVVVNGHSSKPGATKYGVPQGSVLGPLLFTTYTSSLGTIIRRNNQKYQLYADDTQLYIGFEHSNEQDEIGKLEKCLSEIRYWMKANKLKLNDDKTELLKIGSKYHVSKTKSNSLKIGDTVVEANTKSVRNLGVHFNSLCDMSDNITSVCKSVNFHLHNVGKIRNFIDQPTAKMLVNSLVTSRIVYCNSLLYNSPKYQIGRLQKLQNKAARIVTRSKTSENISPILKELHWLPIKYRIEFKILSMTYATLNCEFVPEYLKDLLTPYTPSRTLRSSSSNLLVKPKNKTIAGTRTFSYAAPELWNGLNESMKNASSITTFRKNLKTVLFQRAFKC
ncbi:hypothetical protein SNE40_013140 [Patella caerulea]|uniref:Reverse transcriptase domain-containing protein n=1 Tax=Patella caerulea TaxID=87958 RepID=A0AAN8JIS6_PATCE